MVLTVQVYTNWFGRVTVYNGNATYGTSLRKLVLTDKSIQNDKALIFNAKNRTWKFVECDNFDEYLKGLSNRYPCSSSHAGWLDFSNAHRQTGGGW